jgi:ABC-type multidrug transport system fused ATPase/permease subunit
MLKFVGDLIRPYRGTLAIILLAMLVETVMSLAAPWPLKIILDSVVGSHKLTPWMRHLMGSGIESGSKLHFALVASVAFVVIAILGAIASYMSRTTCACGCTTTFSACRSATTIPIRPGRF